MTFDEAELIIIDPPAASRDVAGAMIGECIIRGIDLYVEPDDQLPVSLPAHVQGVKAIIVDAHCDARIIEACRQSSAHVYLMDERTDPCRWDHPTFVDMLMLDAALTPHHPRQRARFAARDEKALLADMIAMLLKADQIAWHDATRYQWDALLDAYELTGDAQCLRHVRALVDRAMTLDNPLDNCDTVTPLGPLARLAVMDDKSALLDHAVRTMDAYLDVTPRYKGALVGFRGLPHHARAETIWQVGTALCSLADAAGRDDYRDLAIEQAIHLDQLLHDEVAGLWRHAVGDGVTTGAYWGRCCAFVSLGLLRIIEAMPRDHGDRALLAARAKRMIETLVQHQHESGFWFTVIDEPLSDFESSGTAWITAAIERAVAMELIDARHRAAADRGWLAVKSRIWRGGYPGHNTATTVSPSRSYYVKRHLSPTGWTHFAFRAACERLRCRAGVV